VFHVINRGNDRRTIFFEDADYEVFFDFLEDAKTQYAVQVFGVCLMPNHFHAVIQPEVEGALSAYLQRVSGRYACHLRRRTQTVGHGHVFQRRFWSDSIKDPYHFLSVLRYVEANPLQAQLVGRAEEWPWSSMARRPRAYQPLLDPLPVALPRNWSELVNAPEMADF
jgi:putative transposase